ncbi:50S ribosome-binding GTPase [Candidatus Pacearchaeota archaeon]|nr:50S ribosome-binding GTPase [Candidatus Pacearchaeota archaeon]
MGFWFIVERVMRSSDITVFILDARMPELSRNIELEERAKRLRVPILYVLNKMDLVSPDKLDELRENYPEALLVSGVKNIGIKDLKTKLLIMGKRMGNKSPKIGIVGYPNVGKSAIINAMAHRARAKVSIKAGTTRGVQFIRAGSLKILDTPGVVPFEDKESKLGMIAAKNPEKLRNPEHVAIEILEKLLKNNKPAIEKYSGAHLIDEEPHSILEQIGRHRGFLKKGGSVDEIKTAITLVRDWQRGKIRD